MEYNTSREHLILPEYGRNVQKIVEHIVQLPNKEDRTRLAHTLIGLMKQLNPSVKEHDNPQRIWDHLYVMSNFKLDIDSPYPTPDESILYKRPERMPYQEHELKFKHYGRNIAMIIEKALATEDEEQRKFAVVQVGKLMKNFYAAWNKENMDDEVIVNNLYEISEGRINLRADLAANPHLFDNYSSINRGADRHERDNYRNSGQSQQHYRRKDNNKDRRKR